MKLHQLQTNPPDLVMAIGTTAVFPYILEPIMHCARTDFMTAEINPAQTGLSDLVDISLRMGAVEAMDRIWNSMSE